MKKIPQDFKTTADFRKGNGDSIESVFKEFFYLCKSLDLFGLEIVGIDGSKFRAVNSKDRNFNEKLLSNLKAIDEKIEYYLKELEANDTKNDDSRRWERVKKHDNLQCSTHNPVRPHSWAPPSPSRCRLSALFPRQACKRQSY